MFNRGGGGGGFGGARLLIALVVGAFALFRYLSSAQVNPVTGEKQRVGDISPRQEIALGLQALPSLARQYGGLSSDPQGQAVVDRVGARIVQGSDAAKSPYRYQFHLLDDPNTINAFALPGGQIFLTSGLMKRLRSEGEVAGVLGHEVGHVVARHGAEHIAKQQLTQGLTGAAVLATYDPNNPNSYKSAAVLQAISGLINMKYGRSDELEADQLGVKLIAQAGYDPRALIGVMEVLQKAAAGKGRQPEFFSSHPNPENRVAKIKEAIAQQFPDGVPAGLER
jgi:predicted Zn-dependent protease